MWLLRRWFLCTFSTVIMICKTTYLKLDERNWWDRSCWDLLDNGCPSADRSHSELSGVNSLRPTPDFSRALDLDPKRSAIIYTASQWKRAKFGTLNIRQARTNFDIFFGKQHQHTFKKCGLFNFLCPFWNIDQNRVTAPKAFQSISQNRQRTLSWRQSSQPTRPTGASVSSEINISSLIYPATQNRREWYLCRLLQQLLVVRQFFAQLDKWRHISVTWRQLVLQLLFRLQQKMVLGAQFVYSWSEKLKFAESLAQLAHFRLKLISSTRLNTSTAVEILYRIPVKQESVRPRWPYDMRPSVRAEKYMCVIVIR